MNNANKEDIRRPASAAVGFFDLSHEFLSSRPELWRMMGHAGEHLNDSMKLLRTGSQRSRDHADAIEAFMLNPLNEAICEPGDKKI